MGTMYLTNLHLLKRLFTSILRRSIPDSSSAVRGATSRHIGSKPNAMSIPTLPVVSQKYRMRLTMSNGMYIMYLI